VAYIGLIYLRPPLVETVTGIGDRASLYAPETKIAVMATEPRIDGRQSQVIVPPFTFVTESDLQPGIVFPAARKVTFPFVLTVTDKVVVFLYEAALGKFIEVIVGGVHAERYETVTNPIPTLFPTVFN
jgi:hypothetical protein